ncbi:MAG: hypothetical protein HOP17_08110 [Acidobacteria bacterium]|nr:hypothetical protein [Acidobacteriota bacterium]
MKLANITAILIVSICQYIFAQPLRAVDRTADRTQILAEIESISKAYVGRDPLPFESIYLENYVSIREKPVYNVREQLIAMMKADSIILNAGKKLDYETLFYETENPQIRFYGRAALVISTKKNLWQYHSQKCLTKMVSTELWVKPERDWKLAAGHATTFQCDPKPYHPIHKAVATIPARGKPVNTDPESEQQIRELLGAFAKAQAAGGKTYDSVLESVVVKDFKAIDLSGESVTDLSTLADIQAPAAARSPGLRNQDDALVIYPDAAVYTFKVRPPAASPANNLSKQCSIFFVKTENRWMIAGAHVSKYLAD